jgi:undecaprenyl diphosphate synthase
MLPKDAKIALAEAAALTAQNTGLTLIIALSYSSRWELVEATKIIAQKVQNGQLAIEDINDATISENLSTSDFPDPALMIRTSGECRISNFLLYQLAYAELYFTDTRWPEFRKDDLVKALLDFQSRERRFGKTSEQVQLD